MHFDQFAGNYKQVLDRSLSASGEDSAYFAKYKARYLARVLRENPPAKVMDFGCGVGLLSGFLQKHLGPIWLDGFDVSPASIHQVPPNLTESGAFTSDPQQLSRDYDLIVIANVLHHVPPEERAHTIAELAARLRPTGKIAIFEHNPANPVTRRTVERCPFDQDAILLRPAEAASLLSNAGLRISRRDYIVFMPRVLSLMRPVEPWLNWLPLGAQFAIIGEKHA
jgi:SAM-dependent methyltransferase